MMEQDGCSRMMQQDDGAARMQQDGCSRMMEQDDGAGRMDPYRQLMVISGHPHGGEIRVCLSQAATLASSVLHRSWSWAWLQLDGTSKPW